jgi:hypothetical protein
LTGKPHLSYSSLDTYLSCGEKYRLQKIERVPEAPAYWFPGGTAVHTGTEVFDLCLRVDGLHPDEALDAATKAFHNKFSEELDRYSADNPGAEWRAGGRATKQWPNKEDAAWWRHDGPIQVKQYAQWRLANSHYDLWFDPAGIVGVEYPVTSEFAGLDLPVQGYIDRVFVDQRSGNLVIVDVKSGSRIPAGIIQLAIYATALEEQVGIRPQFGAYYMTRKAELTMLSDLSRFNDKMLGQWLRNAKTGIEGDLFTPRVSSDCGYCSVAESCYAQNPNVLPPF